MLKPICQLAVEPDCAKELHLPEAICEGIKAYYSGKWQATESVAENITALGIDLNEGPTTISQDEVTTAAMNIKRKHRTDCRARAVGV